MNTLLHPVLASLQPLEFLTGVWSLAMLVLGIVVNFLFAILVFSDRPPRRVLAPVWVWSLATPVGGVFTAALYALLHHGLPGVAAPRDA